MLGLAYVAVSIAGPAQVVGGGAGREDTGRALCLASAGIIILTENDIAVRTVKSGWKRGVNRAT